MRCNLGLLIDEMPQADHQTLEQSERDAREAVDTLYQPRAPVRRGDDLVEGLALGKERWN
jgi:hypothetical protein